MLRTNIYGPVKRTAFVINNLLFKLRFVRLSSIVRNYSAGNAILFYAAVYFIHFSYAIRYRRAKLLDLIIYRSIIIVSTCASVDNAVLFFFYYID